MQRVSRMELTQQKEIARRIIENIDIQSRVVDSVTRYSRLVPIAENACDWEMDADRKRDGDVLVRAFVAKQMVSEGFSLNSIGRAMGRDHATVLFARRIADAVESGYQGAERQKKWRKFQTLLMIENENGE